VIVVAVAFSQPAAYGRN